MTVTLKLGGVTVGTCVTGSNGCCTFSLNDAPGTYEVSASWTHSSVSYSKSATVALACGDSKSVTLGCRTICVVDCFGASIGPGVTVQLLSGGTVIETATTDELGCAHFAGNSTSVRVPAFGIWRQANGAISFGSSTTVTLTPIDGWICCDGPDVAHYGSTATISTPSGDLVVSGGALGTAYNYYGVLDGLTATAHNRCSPRTRAGGRSIALGLHHSACATMNVRFLSYNVSPVTTCVPTPYHATNRLIESDATVIPSAPQGGCGVSYLCGGVTQNTFELGILSFTSMSYISLDPLIISYSFDLANRPATSDAGNHPLTDLGWPTATTIVVTHHP